MAHTEPLPLVPATSTPGIPTCGSPSSASSVLVFANPRRMPGALDATIRSNDSRYGLSTSGDRAVDPTPGILHG
jgi:hypothetical protein